MISVVEPAGNEEPDEGGSFKRKTTLLSSSTDGSVHVATASPVTGSGLRMRSAGQ